MRMEELLLLKQLFGMSVQALVHRLFDLNIISQSHYRRWRMEINRLGVPQTGAGDVTIRTA